MFTASFDRDEEGVECRRESCALLMPELASSDMLTRKTTTTTTTHFSCRHIPDAVPNPAHIRQLDVPVHPQHHIPGFQISGGSCRSKGREGRAPRVSITRAGLKNACIPLLKKSGLRQGGGSTVIRMLKKRFMPCRPAARHQYLSFSFSFSPSQQLSRKPCSFLGSKSCTLSTPSRNLHDRPPAATGGTHLYHGAFFRTRFWS